MARKTHLGRASLLGLVGMLLVGGLWLQTAWADNTVDDLLSDLGEHQAARRTSAAQQLMALGAAQVAEPLHALLDNADAALRARMEAAALIARMHLEGGAAHLDRVVQDAEAPSDLRAAALQALVAWPEMQATILRAIGDTDASVAMTALLLAAQHDVVGADDAAMRLAERLDAPRPARILALRQLPSFWGTTAAAQESPDVTPLAMALETLAGDAATEPAVRHEARFAFARLNPGPADADKVTVLMALIGAADFADWAQAQQAGAIDPETPQTQPHQADDADATPNPDADTDSTTDMVHTMRLPADEASAREASRLLATLGEPAVIALLAIDMHEIDPFVLSDWQTALSTCDAAVVVPALVGHLAETSDQSARMNIDNQLRRIFQERPQAVTYVQTLSEYTPGVIDVVSRVLVDVGSPAAVEAVLPILSEPGRVSTAVRADLMERLSAQTNDRSSNQGNYLRDLAAPLRLQAAMACLDDPSPRVRRASLELLRKTQGGMDQISSALRDALQERLLAEDDDTLRGQVATLFSQLDPVNAPTALVRLLPQMRDDRGLADVLEAVGGLSFRDDPDLRTEVLDFAEGVLTDNERSMMVRRAAASAVAGAADPVRSVRILQAVLNTLEPRAPLDLRSHVISQLGHPGLNARGEGILVAVMTTMDVSQRALRSSEELTAGESRDDHVDLIKNALRFLGNSQNVTAVEPIVGCLTQREGGIDGEAANALRSLSRSRNAIAAILTELQDYISAAASGQLEDSHLQRMADVIEDAWPTVTRAMATDLRSAGEATGTLTTVIDVVQSMKPNLDPRTRQQAERLMLTLLGSSRTSILERAVRALGEVGSARVLGPMIQLGSAHPELQQAVRDAANTLAPGRWHEPPAWSGN